MITKRTALVRSSVISLFGNQAQASTSTIIAYPRFASTYIEPRTIHVWLPPNYDSSSRRYRVIYLQDGQNAFSPVYAASGQPWRIDQAIEARMKTDDGAAAIVVAIWNTSKRRSEFAPTRLEGRLPAPLRQRIENENGNHSAGDAYLSFIVTELKPFIDGNYRTERGPQSTMLMGASRGGMISLYGLCQHPDIFGVAACLSTHWLLLSAPSATTDPNLETNIISNAICDYLKAKLPSPKTHKIWMDHGTINLDSYYAPYQTAIDQAFLDRRWKRGRDFCSRVYQGADHNEVAWRSRLSDPLNFVLSDVP